MRDPGEYAFSVTLNPAATFKHADGSGCGVGSVRPTMHTVRRSFETSVEVEAYEKGLKDGLHMLGEAVYKLKGQLE